MNQVPRDQVIQRIRMENPWWQEPAQIPPDLRRLKHRAYFESFYDLVRRDDPRRAVLLLGPRRVGKTVLIYQAVQRLIDSGVSPRQVGCVSIDHPLYNDRSLDEIVDLFVEASGGREHGKAFLFLDEIQYMREWERYLKVLVDRRGDLKLIASGSAAAALRLRSQESGAGRFTEFLLPPLTFHEYLLLLGKTDLALERADPALLRTFDPRPLNEAFLHYINYGGYPEVLFSEAVRSDMPRFIKADIVDKVLLRDLPGLYGISDIQELNRLFTALAYNTANEVSLEELSQNSGVAKNTIKRYIEYLEAAFLIQRVHRVDQTGRRFQRANYFKVYLINPTMRSALFAPVDEADPRIGGVVETAVFSQWFHARAQLYYARWKTGEVDLVSLDSRSGLDPTEIKWSDRAFTDPKEIAGLLEFCKARRLTKATVTTRAVCGSRDIAGVSVTFAPTSLYCAAIGRVVPGLVGRPIPPPPGATADR